MKLSTITTTSALITLSLSLLLGGVAQANTLSKEVKVLKSAVLKAFTPPKASVGIGIGPTYGFAGVSGEYFFDYKWAVSAALGRKYRKTTYNVGLKRYFGDNNSTFRPLLSVNYGTVGLLKHKKPGEHYKHKSFSNFSVGTGMGFAFGENKNHIIDLDVSYSLGKSKFKKEIREHEKSGTTVHHTRQGHVNWSLGYRYRF
jgi:hypothetical protein